MADLRFYCVVAGDAAVAAERRSDSEFMFTTVDLIQMRPVCVFYDGVIPPVCRSNPNAQPLF
jgi:hypothetical protein